MAQIYLKLTEEEYSLVMEAMQFYLEKQKEEKRKMANYVKLFKEALYGPKEDYASKKLKEMFK